MYIIGLIIGLRGLVVRLRRLINGLKRLHLTIPGYGGLLAYLRGHHILARRHVLPSKELLSSTRVLRG